MLYPAELRPHIVPLTQESHEQSSFASTRNTIIYLKVVTNLVLPRTRIQSARVRCH
jgi:hypothetical protein